jgi:pilus assembly protein CpaB
MKLQLNRNIISLISALLLGAVAVVAVNVYLAKERSRLHSEAKQQLGGEVAVVIAKTDIARGTKITNNMLKISNVKEAALQPRVINSVEAAIGKVAIADIVSGEQVSSTKLMSGPLTTDSSRDRSSLSGGGALAMKIPSGKRAFTFSIDEIAAVGGMVRPGDYVDVVGTFPFTQQQAEGKIATQNVTVTLFQNILVLAVGKQTAATDDTTASGRGAGNTITVALTPQQAELLNFAQDGGKLRLILRPPLESQIQTIQPVTTEVLWQQILTQSGMQLPMQDTKEESGQDKKSTQTVEIYRGNEKQVTPLE